MDRRLVGFCLLALAIALAGCGGAKDKVSNDEVRAGRDRELYEEAMGKLRKSRYDEARLMLNVVITSYPDSEFLPLAKLAIADSFYREGGSTALEQTDCFVLADRMALSDVQREQELGLAGVTGREYSAAAGSVIGAQILVKGEITEFEPGKQGRGMTAGIGLDDVGLRLGGNRNTTSRFRRYIGDAIAAGAGDIELLKIWTRVTMGPCQGRMCIPALAERLRSRTHRKPALPRARPPCKPLPVAWLKGASQPAASPSQPPAL